MSKLDKPAMTMEDLDDLPFINVLDAVKPARGVKPFPDPRDATVNEPLVMLSPSQADRLFKHRQWPGAPGSKLDMVFPTNAHQHRSAWFKIVAKKMGWKDVFFHGHQIILKAEVVVKDDEGGSVRAG